MTTRTHCRAGHALDAENGIPRPLKSGRVGLDCRACRAARRKGDGTRRHKDNPNRGGVGLSRAQIAAILGVTENRVGQIEREAIAKMRAHADPDLLAVLELLARRAAPPAYRDSAW